MLNFFIENVVCQSKPMITSSSFKKTNKRTELFLPHAIYGDTNYKTQLCNPLCGSPNAFAVAQIYRGQAEVQETHPQLPQLCAQCQPPCCRNHDRYQLLLCHSRHEGQRGRSGQLPLCRSRHPCRRGLSGQYQYPCQYRYPYQYRRLHVVHND